jgi:hypothetical protein
MTTDIRGHVSQWRNIETRIDELVAGASPANEFFGWFQGTKMPFA